MSITKSQFQAYESVRASGVTNMWASQVVSDISGLSRAVILEIIKNYDALASQYPDVLKEE